MPVEDNLTKSTKADEEESKGASPVKPPTAGKARKLNDGSKETTTSGRGKRNTVQSKDYGAGVDDNLDGLDIEESEDE